MIPDTAGNKQVQSEISMLSQEERLDLAAQLLKDLKPLKEKADKAEFEFLSYLLGMAILEVHSIVGGPIESAVPVCGFCGFSYDLDPLSESGEVFL